MCCPATGGPATGCAERIEREGPRACRRGSRSRAPASRQGKRRTDRARHRQILLAGRRRRALAQAGNWPTHAISAWLPSNSRGCAHHRGSCWHATHYSGPGGRSDPVPTGGLGKSLDNFCGSLQNGWLLWRIALQTSSQPGISLQQSRRFELQGAMLQRSRSEH